LSRRLAIKPNEAGISKIPCVGFADGQTFFDTGHSVKKTFRHHLLEAVLLTLISLVLNGIFSETALARILVLFVG